MKFNIKLQETMRKARRSCFNFVRQALEQLEHMETSKLVAVILSIINSDVITGNKLPPFSHLNIH